MAISKRQKPDSFKICNSLKLNFNSYVECEFFPWIKLSWYSYRQTWMNQFILAISVWQVIFIVKGGLLLAQDLSLENAPNSIFSAGFTSVSVGPILAVYNHHIYNHQLSFKIFSHFVHFWPNFQIFCLFLPFFWKITHPQWH